MALNFEEIKKIRIIEVCARAGLRLRYRGEYANGPCPLPTHKPGDKARTFSVNVGENYWRCFSDSCNARNSGRKGGDVINLVALLENCSEYQAAEKLATWYGMNGNGKPREARGSPNDLNHSTSAGAVNGDKKERPSSVAAPISSHPSTVGKESKPRYMATIDAWFDELVKRGDQEDETAFWHRVRNGVKAKLIESYKNGKEGK